MRNATSCSRHQARRQAGRHLARCRSVEPSDRSDRSDRREAGGKHEGFAWLNAARYICGVVARCFWWAVQLEILRLLHSPNFGLISFFIPLSCCYRFLLLSLCTLSCRLGTTGGVRAGSGGLSVSDGRHAWVCSLIRSGTGTGRSYAWSRR